MEEVKDVTAAVKLKRCVEGVSVGWVGGAARMAVFERDECVSNSVLYINVHKVA